MTEQLHTHMKLSLPVMGALKVQIHVKFPEKENQNIPVMNVENIMPPAVISPDTDKLINALILIMLESAAIVIKCM